MKCSCELLMSQETGQNTEFGVQVCIKMYKLCRNYSCVKWNIASLILINAQWNSTH